MSRYANAQDHRRLVEDGRRRAGLTIDELWLRYFGLGGTADAVETEAYLRGVVALPGPERDVLAHAVNEGLAEIQVPERVPYTFDDH
jgi:hypothetical protein